MLLFDTLKWCFQFGFQRSLSPVIVILAVSDTT